MPKFGGGKENLQKTHKEISCFDECVLYLEPSEGFTGMYIYQNSSSELYIGTFVIYPLYIIVKPQTIYTYLSYDLHFYS